MLIAKSWDYPGGDGCCDFFSHYLKAANPDVPAHARVLEIGCSEFDWITQATRCWPEMDLTGIDTRSGENVRGPNARTMLGNVLERDLFAPESFDLIVSISAIEHVGLGHYGDPLDPDGDTKAIAHAFRWLKPGGWLLFDVPYNPDAYKVEGTSHREYDDDALFLRLWCHPLAEAKAKAKWVSTVYTHARDCKSLVEKPKEAAEPFWYVGVGFQKVG